MSSILEELYDGRLFPAEVIVPQDPEYRRLNRRISDLKKTWEQKLAAEDYESLEELLQLQCESGGLEAVASFEYGFKLGALLMLEVLGGRGELARKIKE